MTGLTPKQKAFVNEYLICFNATQSAIRAGYSERTAYSIGARLLKNVEISAVIEKTLNEHAMSAKEVLYHLAQFARGLVEHQSNSDRLRALDLLAKYHNLANTTQIKTWKDDAIDAIKDGRIEYEDLCQVAIELGEPESLATELFRLAGVPIPDSKAGESERNAEAPDTP